MRNSASNAYALSKLNYDTGAVEQSTKISARVDDEVLDQILTVDKNGYPIVAFQDTNQYFIVAKFAVDLSSTIWAVTY